MQSLTSKGLVKTQFSWQWYYYTLTDEGIDYLRECKVYTYKKENINLYILLDLHLPQEIVPATMKKTARPASSAPRRTCK